MSKATKKTASKGAITAPEAGKDNAPRPDVNQNDLAGSEVGPGPRVGASAFQSTAEDHVTKGRPQTDSDGTNAGSLAPTADKAAKIPVRLKVKTSDPVCWVTVGRNAGKVRPAVVLRPTDPNIENADRFPIDLVAFTDGGGARGQGGDSYPNNDHLSPVLTQKGVFYSEDLQPGTWHLPEDTDKLIAAKEKSDATKLEKEQESRNSARRNLFR